ncbi:lamin tail domain-containing protein [Algoriphagus terrigena]|uniref:lamin tail domain-containing protein n=1 Tax=Algoriphagus terrigena TaxID=344884 RepID=UPI000411F2DA|nr:lamin tail domain-containing protein [Algoriphagus terrigena]
MKRHFSRCLVILVLLLYWIGISFAVAQVQTFEADFQAVSFPAEFLPNWYGNEVNAGSSRIFQGASLGRNASKSLAVQPISTFNGKIWVRLFPQDFDSPEVIFYARSVRNGSGTRPALVFYSWGESLNGEFSTPTQIGTDSEFANEDQEWRKFSIRIPDELRDESEVVLFFEIRYGSGSGSAARWLMDDFEFGDFVKDEIPPSVTDVKGYSDRSVLVRFSEKLDPVFSVFQLAYELNGQNPESAELRQDSTVMLSFSEELEPRRTYSLSLRQLADLEGNFLNDTSFQFTFFDPTDIPRKGLVINELMPAPRADRDLPNVEYIELFHNGENEFRLEGVRLSNSRTETALSEYWIKPGEYLIVAPESQAYLLDEFGKVLPVKNWPTLLNSGDQITLKSASGSEIDQISFATATWGGSDFADGGYSLEVPSPDFLCSNTSLLRPSMAPNRGTPGSQNSVYTPDPVQMSPQLESVYFMDSLQVRLVFTEPVFPDFDSGNMMFLPSLTVDSLRFMTNKDVLISLKSPAESNKVYEIKIVGIEDCFGNPLAEQSFSFVLPESPQLGELIINELLFNPRTGEPKFVELRNTSQKYLRLENWALSALDEAENPDQAKVFGGLGSILEPDGYLAVTTDSSALKKAYPKSFQGNFSEIATLPSYPIAGGTVVLLSPKGQIVETFAYDEDLHHPLLRDPKGVSLERISPLSAALDPSNWQSASGSEDFATPGRKNSQTMSDELQSDWIQIEPEVFDPEGSAGAAFTTVSYQLDQPGWTGTFKIYATSGQLIQTLAQNQILGTTGFFVWSGTDTTGKLVRAGYYVLVVELYEPSGRTKVLKKTLVVATRL